jgi:EAL domain-containing protein (putative c-di-GMP-specific phosphodiesterase class I)
LKRLQSIGVEWSIDDFGTGYSSLSYLHQLQADTVKVDRSFVSRMGAEVNGSEMVSAIVALAQNMGMDVVAEGVETLSQLTQLRKLNCQYGQGYLFSRPVDAEAVAPLLSKRPHWQADLFPALINEHYVPVKPAAVPVIQLVGASA